MRQRMPMTLQDLQTGKNEIERRCSLRNGQYAFLKTFETTARSLLPVYRKVGNHGCCVNDLASNPIRENYPCLGDVSYRAIFLAALAVFAAPQVLPGDRRAVAAGGAKENYKFPGILFLLFFCDAVQLSLVFIQCDAHGCFPRRPSDIAGRVFGDHVGSQICGRLSFLFEPERDEGFMLERKLALLKICSREKREEDGGEKRREDVPTAPRDRQGDGSFVLDVWVYLIKKGPSLCLPSKQSVF